MTVTTTEDRVQLTPNAKEFTDELREKHFLAFSSSGGRDENAAQNKDIFLLAVALGRNAPKPLRRRIGWAQWVTFTDEYQAVLRMLEMIDSGETNMEVAIQQNKVINRVSEMANKGFEILESRLEAADGDFELLEDRMLNELDGIYRRNILGD